MDDSGVMSLCCVLLQGKPFWYNSATQESTWDRPGTPAFHKKYTMKYNTAKGSLGTCRSKKTGSRLEVGAVWKLYPWEWLAQEDVGRIVEENPGADACGAVLSTSILGRQSYRCVQVWNDAFTNQHGSSLSATRYASQVMLSTL